MKITKNDKFRVSALWLLVTASIAFGLGVTLSAGRAGDPEHELQRILNGTKTQAVTKLDRTGLKLVLNDRMEGVTLDGWSTKQLTQPQADSLMDQFGVRVVKNEADGTATFLAPSNVGRAGILEGQIYLKMDGKVYKGLTLKGYGGNTVHNHDEQPQGSLDQDESIRDMEVSTILAESHVNTYVGIVALERPSASGRYGGAVAPKSNYVRISRTALRMEDLIRVNGADSKALVNYLTDLMKDEMGKKLTPAEFDAWLVSQTGDLMARKDYIRFMHASITDSNLGIGELVDLGDIRDGGAMRLPGTYTPQNSVESSWGTGMEGFKEICRKAHANISAADSSIPKIDFDKTFDEAYKTRMDQMQAFDRARVNLNRATTAELEKLGFTTEEAEAVIKLNTSTPDGIIDPTEVATLKEMTRDVSSILERTTSDFMRLADGSQLSAYYLRNLGGAEGVRVVLEGTREFMRKNGITLARDAAGQMTGDVAKVSAEIGRLALERAKAAGFERVATANVISNFSKFISSQALEVIVRR